MSHPISRALATLANEITAIALSADPQTRGRLSELDGRCIEIQCTNPPLLGCLHIHSDKVVFSDDACTSPNVVVAGSLTELASWLIPFTAHGGKAVRIDGDEATLQAFMAIVQQLEPDLQRPLSQLLGEETATRLVAGAELGLNGLRSLLQGVSTELENRFKTRTQANFTVNQEANALHTRLDALRLRVDRLSARLAMAEHARDEPGASG